MRHLISSVTLGAVAALSLVGCVDIDPGGYGGGYGSSGYGGGGYGSSSYGRPSSAYRPGYGTPAPSSYRYDHDHYGYDRDHHSSSSHTDNRNYFGGEAAWYKAGVGIGKKDRHEHRSADYRRHKSQYDGRTEREFARGYNDGYRRG